MDISWKVYLMKYGYLECKWPQNEICVCVKWIYVHGITMWFNRVTKYGYSYETLCQNNICSTTHNLKGKKQIKCLLADEWIKKIFKYSTYILWSTTQPIRKWTLAILSSTDDKGVKMIREIRYRKDKSSTI